MTCPIFTLTLPQVVNLLRSVKSDIPPGLSVQETEALCDFSRALADEKYPGIEGGCQQSPNDDFSD